MARTRLRLRLFRLLFWLPASLPYGLRYAVSDGLYWTAYRLLGYRTKVVRDNLHHAFPEKSDAERKTIERRFYRHFCDMLVETLALARARPEQVVKRWTVNFRDFDETISRSGRGLILLVSHQFNWEEGSWVLAPFIRAQQAVVYTSIGDPDFAQAFLEVRERNGQVFVHEKEMIRLFRLLKSEPCVVLLAADQSPFTLRSARWEKFFHRPTPFHQGVEAVARRTGYGVAFLELIRHGRGHYEAAVHHWPHKPAEMPEGELTAAYVRFIEASIRRQPENYLWTHRRWKHSHRWREFMPEGT